MRERKRAESEREGRERGERVVHITAEVREREEESGE